MLKNSTKLTSLVVAAATIASMTPAFAATTSLDEKDGTVYRAVAYKDGKFYIDGEVEDKDNSVYFLDNGKYTELEDVDNGSDAELYGEKYVKIDDGDAYLDLSNGKVNDDDDLAEDDAEDAETALDKKIKKDEPDDRYELFEDKPQSVSGVDYQKVVSAPYIENYYEYAVKANKSKDVNDFRNRDYKTVYADKNGKYVDADYDLGKIKLVIAKQDINFETASKITADMTTDDIAKLSTDDKGLTKLTSDAGAGLSVKFDKNEVITIDNTKDYFKTDNKQYAFRARITNSRTLTQDKDYIYRMAGIAIDLYRKGANNEWTIACADLQKYNDLAFGGINDVVKVQKADVITVIQKISKEQNSDEIDDAKYPKSTDTYFFTEYTDFYAKKGKKYENRLASRDGGEWNRRKVLVGIDGSDEVTGANLVDYMDGRINDASELDGGWSVVNGKLNNYRFNSDNFKAQTFTLKEKAGYYYLDKEDGDFDVDDDEYDSAVDSEGNIWVLDNGKIKKYNNDGSFDTVYKCDGAMDSISVYDKDNVIVWNEDEDEFAILGGKSTTGKEDTEDTTTTTAQAGWVTNADGTWSYINADGTKAIGWLQSPASGLWYHMDANGIMESGKWLQDAGSWYYLNADGSMKTGWLYNGGAWYYLKPSAGNMGAMQTGWIQSGGKWYYCNASGAMLSNTTVNGYVLGADGAWIK